MSNADLMIQVVNGPFGRRLARCVTVCIIWMIQLSKARVTFRKGCSCFRDSVHLTGMKTNGRGWVRRSQSRDDKATITTDLHSCIQHDDPFDFSIGYFVPTRCIIKEPIGFKYSQDRFCRDHLFRCRKTRVPTSRSRKGESSSDFNRWIFCFLVIPCFVPLGHFRVATFNVDEDCDRILNRWFESWEFTNLSDTNIEDMTPTTGWDDVRMLLCQLSFSQVHCGLIVGHKSSELINLLSMAIIFNLIQN